MTSETGFGSPDHAALAGWRGAPAAHARVRSVTIRNGRAEVVVETDQTDPDYVDYTYCVQGADGRWHEVLSGIGPAAGWDDPNELAWPV